MSTKTTFKRVALVAVAALGFGVLSSVAPASAAEASNAKVTAVTIATPGTGRVGAAFTSQVGFTTDTSVAGDTFTFRARFDSKPATSTAAVTFNTSGLAIATTSDEAGTVTAANGAGNELLPVRLYITAATGNPGSQTAVAGRVGFIPDVVGSYVVTIWKDTDLDGLIGASEATATKTFTVGNAPASVAVSKINGTAAATTAGSGNGALVKLSLLDSAGLAAGLASNETIVLTPSTGYDVTAVNGTDPSVATSAAASLVAANFIGGVAWVNLTGPAGTGTFSLSATGTAIDTITGVFTISYKTVVAGTTATTVHGDAVTSAYGAGLNAAGTITTATMPLGANTVSYTTTASTGFATGDYALATITDSNGRVTGSSTQAVTGLKYDLAYVLTEIAAASATKTGSFSVSVSASTTATQGFNVVTGAGTAINSGVTAAASSLTSSSGTLTVSPSSALSLKNAGSITYTVTLKDQFGVAQPNVTVTLSGGTRNAVSAATAAPTAVTNASGQASFTITDAPSAAAILAAYTTDAFTFTATGGTTVTAGTITWSATGPAVAKVTILGGDNGTTTGVASATPNVKDINAGDGVEAGTNTFTATVKDASGNLLAGVPVTFTVSGTGAAVLSTTQTVYTGAAGTAAASVYGWIKGTYTVTATAGGISGTAGFTVAQLAAGEERKISASAEGSIVTATVVDRFGNPVPGVTVYATKTGAGYFGAGTTKTFTTTNAAGQAEFVIAGGSADVTVALLSYDAVAGTKSSGQSCAAAGNVDCATTPTAFTATTAGTSTKAEAGVGASIAAAGVSSATAAVSNTVASDAADAAAEATDAANAATDAANAAAEAADAATAAAQDAADAVAALSTQVSEMIDALKKQITALTNLVIKIQKKVKA